MTSLRFRLNLKAHTDTLHCILSIDSMVWGSPTAINTTFSSGHGSSNVFYYFLPVFALFFLHLPTSVYFSPKNYFFLPRAFSCKPGTKGFAVENELLAGAHNPERSTAINSYNGVFTTQLLVIGFSKAIRGKGLSKNRPTSENAVA